MKFKILIVASLITAGCTSIDIKPVAPTAELRNVCIVNNPKVIVSDFIPVLRDGFSRHGIATSVVDQSGAQSCDVTLTYTALRSWDFKPYVSHAELRLWRGGMQIGSADYHLKGKGGLSLTKWGSTQEKLDPVIDRLLGDHGDGHVPLITDERPAPANNPSSPQAPQPAAESCRYCTKMIKQQ